MAFPNAESYSRTLDTLASMSLDTRTSDVHTTVTDFGEKFIKTINNKGRVFVVNDAEGLRHPVASTGAEPITYFAPDDMGGGSYNFTTAALDPLSQIQFTMPAATININFPQAMPAGDLVNYVDTRIKMTMIDLFNSEEKLLLLGEQNGDGKARYRSPFYGDSTYGDNAGGSEVDDVCKYEVGIPTNLPSFFMGGTTASGLVDVDDDGTNSIDAKGEMFAGMKMSTFPAAEYDQPKKTAWGGNTEFTTTSAADPKILWNSLNKIILETTYSEIERPTDIWTSLEVFNGLITGLRELGALPDPVQANMGKMGSIPFAGLDVDWHRYFTADSIWNTTTDVSAAEIPILGINFNSLRLNLVKRGGGLPHDEVGMFESVGEMELAHTLPILYKRVQWKRQLSWDHGRRSSFMLTGVQTVA
jgi:hypothetical protein